MGKKCISSSVSNKFITGQAGYFRLQIIEGLNILQKSTDPGIFVLVGWWWWGGGPGANDRIKLIFFFFKSSTYLTDRSNGFFSGKTTCRGGGGGWGGGAVTSNIFQGIQIPMETYRTCNFSGGVQTPSPPPAGTHILFTADYTSFES